MKENRPDLENPKELYEYLNNLDSHLPGSNIREIVLKLPQSKVIFKELPNITKEINGEKIYSERRLNGTFEDFYGDVDEVLRQIGSNGQEVIDFRSRLTDAKKRHDSERKREILHEFLKLQLKVHDALIEMGYNHYEIIA